jgi:hypothetical protein
MNHFNSIRELLSILSRGQKLLTEMFEKRKSLSYKYDYAVELMEGNEDIIRLLINKDIIKQNGNLLELDDQFLKFFEDILEVNEEINTSYVNENIRQIKDEYIQYYLKAESDNERYRYLKAVRSALSRIGRITERNIVDLNRNIENAFKTETNFKIKLSKLENYKTKLTAIQQLIEQTERLINDEELTFFKRAVDEELKFIKLGLVNDLTQYRQNLIETRKQIIDYINQIKYQSRFIEKLKLIKYLRDQFELKHKTNIIEILSRHNAIAFEPKPAYSLKLSIDDLQNDENRSLILKVLATRKNGVQPKIKLAENLTESDLHSTSEKEYFINLEKLKTDFEKSGMDLFNYVTNTHFSPDIPYSERVTVYCQILSFFDEELVVTEKYDRINNVEYALVYPRSR